MSRVFISAFLFSLSIGSSFAQSDRELAQSVIDTLPPISGELTQGNMEATVGSYTTSTPPETQLDHTEFEAEQLRLQTENSDASKALTASKDSFVTRPSIALPEDPLSLADDAIDQSESVVGGLFSSTGGVCSQEFRGGQFQGTKICRKILSNGTENCQENRIVSVDREDSWSCSSETTQYVKTCNKPVAWSCFGNTGGTCRKQAVSIWPHPVSWNPGAWDGTVSLPNQSTGSCSIKTDTFYMNRKDFLTGGSFELNRLTHWGALQIRIDGQNVFTLNGPNQNLNIRNRGCGWFCNVTAIYAGDSWIEDCGSHQRTTWPRIDLYPRLSVGAPGPSWEIGTTVGMSHFKTSQTIRIDIVRGNTNEGTTTPLIFANGNCCSYFLATVDGAC